MKQLYYKKIKLTHVTNECFIMFCNFYIYSNSLMIYNYLLQGGSYDSDRDLS